MGFNSGFKGLIHKYNIYTSTQNNIRLFADNGIIYRKIMDSSNIGKLQTDLKRLGGWAVGNKMKINPGNNKAVSFTKTRVKVRMGYYFGDQLIPHTSSFKNLEIFIGSDWAGRVNYALRKAWKALQFITRVFKEENNNTKRLAYTSLVRPILEY